MIKTYPIIFENNHILIKIEGRLWVYDTGSELTFGTHDVSLLGPPQSTPRSYNGMVSAADISKFINIDVAGLLGTDILNRHDHIIDLQTNTLTVSDDELEVDGVAQPLEFFMGLPTLLVTLSPCQLVTSRAQHALIFDTGAPICYYQGDIPPSATPGPIIKDFHPGFGTFESPSNFFNIELFGVRHRLQFGRLPDLMSMALGMTKCDGILSNELMRNRVTGYFPRRKELVLQS